MTYNIFPIAAFLMVAPGLLRANNYVAALLALALLLTIILPKERYFFLADKYRKYILVVLILTLCVAIYLG